MLKYYKNYIDGNLIKQSFLILISRDQMKEFLYIMELIFYKHYILLKIFIFRISLISHLIV